LIDGMKGLNIQPSLVRSDTVDLDDWAIDDREPTAARAVLLSQSNQTRLTFGALVFVLGRSGQREITAR
jgi:hypothetical protein